jgi:hypothetical protein
MSKCKVTIERISKETYEMDLEYSDCMQALDHARQIVADRNKSATSGTTFRVAKVETIEE